MVEQEGFLRDSETPENLVEDALKLKFFKGSAMPLFQIELQVLQVQVIQTQCVRVEMLLLAKFKSECFEMLKKFGCEFFFCSSTNELFTKPETSFENLRSVTDGTFRVISKLILVCRI